MITIYEYISVKERAEGPSITMYTVKVHFSVGKIVTKLYNLVV